MTGSKYLKWKTVAHIRNIIATDNLATQGDGESLTIIMTQLSRSIPVSAPEWWRHQMETFPRYWSFVRGIHRSPVNSPHKGQWRGDLMFSLIRAWTNGWVNNRDYGDLRRHRAHYDITVIRIVDLAFYLWISLYYGSSIYTYRMIFSDSYIPFFYWMIS